MDAHTVMTTLAGTGGVLLVMAGGWLATHPRRLWNSWTHTERRWRNRRFGGAWARGELAMGRNGFFWVPQDVELAGPDDLYAYAVSDRFWASRFGWFVRALCWYAGALLIFFGVITLGIGLLRVP
jgi:hypothetical protein